MTIDLTNPAASEIDPGAYNAHGAGERLDEAAGDPLGSNAERYNLDAALVQATLALAAEQRTANLIAAYRCAIGQDYADALAAQVQARLGIAP